MRFYTYIPVYGLIVDWIVLNPLSVNVVINVPTLREFNPVLKLWQINEAIFVIINFFHNYPVTTRKFRNEHKTLSKNVLIQRKHKICSTHRTE